MNAFEKIDYKVKDLTGFHNSSSKRFIAKCKREEQQ